MIVSQVVAVSRNGVIGQAGTLPWRLPSDLKRFKVLTLGKPVIMGRKTWESLPKRPLAGRTNIVISGQASYVAEGATVVNGVIAAIEAAQATGAAEACVIGGGEIYGLFMPLTDRIYRTVVEIEVAGDTEFPSTQPDEWRVVESETIVAGTNDTSNFVVQVLDRVRASGRKSTPTT